MRQLIFEKIDKSKDTDEGFTASKAHDEVYDTIVKMFGLHVLSDRQVRMRSRRGATQPYCTIYTYLHTYIHTYILGLEVEERHKPT